VGGDREQGTGDSQSGAPRRKNRNGGKAAQPNSPETSNLKPVTSRNIWRDGLWIGAAAFLIITLGALYQTWLHLGPQGQQERAELKGDGQNVPSYGFDLSKLAGGINPNQIHATQYRKEEIVSLEATEHITQAENGELRGHDKYVLPTDRVVGVKLLGGSAWAYPIQVLQVHQVINVDFGSETYSIAYDPYCDMVNVWSQTSDHNNQKFTWHNSGLSYNGQSLLFRRMGKIVPSIRADEELMFLPLGHRYLTHGFRSDDFAVGGSYYHVCVLQWRDWVELFPDSQLVKRDDMFKQEYKKDKYGPYLISEDIPPGVVPQLAGTALRKLGIHNKSRGIGFAVGEQHYFIPHESLIAGSIFASDEVGRWDKNIDVLDGGRFHAQCRAADVGFTPSTAWLVEYPDYIEYSPLVMFFAWYATYPDTYVVGKDGKLVKP
jgi:hypothetical protein